MLDARFDFQRRPFPATPDSRYYYAATGHERALARVSQALRDDEGLILLTGEPGTGKTLLCHCLLERLPEDTNSAFLTNSHFERRADLLQAILFDLSLPYEGGSEQELRLRLTDFLLKQYAGRRPTVLLIDEAHHLPVDLLEELRLLGNLEAGQGKALQVILVAQPDILATLRRPELAAFAQRLAVRARVVPLGVEEAVDYLLHHLRSAGARPEAVVTEEALELLARSCQGVPRLLNQAAHQALLLTEGGEGPIVDAEVALEALTCLGLETEDVPGSLQQFPQQASQAQTAAARDAGSGAGPTEPSASAATLPVPRLPSYRLFEMPRRPA